MDCNFDKMAVKNDVNKMSASFIRELFHSCCALAGQKLIFWFPIDPVDAKKRRQEV
jgi:hypothetical protein